jgi:hypothetical protein
VGRRPSRFDSITAPATAAATAAQLPPALLLAALKGNFCANPLLMPPRQELCVSSVPSCSADTFATVRRCFLPSVPSMVCALPENWLEDLGKGLYALPLWRAKPARHTAQSFHEQHPQAPPPC